MASILHIAVGLVGGRLYTGKRPRAGPMIAFALGVAYGAEWATSTRSGEWGRSPSSRP